MGLFGWGKKKDGPVKNTAPLLSGQQLREAVTACVAEELARIGFIDGPSSMLTLESDSGLYDTVFGRHITEQRFLAMKKMSVDTYLRVSGMHILGCGMYVRRMQDRFGKAAADFSMEEVKGIVSTWDGTDTFYEGLKVFGCSTDSETGKQLIEVVKKGYEIYIASVSNAWEDPENLNIMMKVMYDAGFTAAEKLSTSSKA